MGRKHVFFPIQNNRSSAISVMVATFIAALLLSLLCGLMYNAWKYEVERIELEEGDWHSRIVGELSAGDLETILNFANVKTVSRSETGASAAVDLIFSDKRAVFTDMPHIAAQLGISQERIVYHYALLAMYLLRGPGDTAPRLLFPLFLLITLAAAFSLIVIIHNSFGVSMDARVHQLGIFSSVGATPRQIRGLLLGEAAALCAWPLLAGTALGVAGSAGLLRLTNTLLGSGVPGRHEAVFGYHPLVLLLTLLVTVATVWISAWLPARRLSRLTPLEAIRGADEWQLKRKKGARLLPLLFGVEGELAGNALKAQKKALRTASLSFLCAFLAFAVMQCVLTLSQISTRETYFARYQDVWDIMVTLRDTGVEDVTDTPMLRELDGVESAIAYQKAAAKRVLTQDEISGELKALGGLPAAQAEVNTPIVILDDDSFLAFCREIGAPERVDGAVILNQIRDVNNPDFRHPVFLPYLNEETAVSVLRPSGGDGAAAVPVLAYTREVPALREEYAKVDFYELVHFVPASLWSRIRGQLGGAEADSYLCIRSREGATLEELNALQARIDLEMGGRYAMETENRIQEYATNNTQIQGMTALFGGFCVLLAIIGVGNVLSNTLGFVRQRRREFARLLSVGLTPKALKKMFCLEAAVIAGKPVLISAPIVIIVIGYLLKMSYMDAGTFLREAPFVPIFLFMLAIFASVALAYSLAWRNIRKIDLAEVLRDDTLL